ncbi:nitrite reductase small subunit NirD [Colwellia sp. 1_MG-2023]|uniref:nitrite reductase small subunit NirD n=1 Tax=Colwellia sp. 1_MG-2023 TaxID=3062649 RepID=UPI0026E23E45|nr:nitrite reductase small subunit NirD [Colwellia sp. 1_MG-2023]MDO6446127.1 nitrite reductase small subunit NirD [Colwellia sp. 1_MG-2023]
MTTNKNWQTICQKDDLVKHSGICALLENDQQIAIFQTGDDQAHTINNWDPAGKANVLYRGIVGDENGELFVASPLYKERFSLQTGKCLDDENLAVTPYQTRIIDNSVQVFA